MKQKLTRNPDNIRFTPEQKYKLLQIAFLEDRPYQWQIRRFVREGITAWERKNGTIPVPESIHRSREKSRE